MSDLRTWIRDADDRAYSEHLAKAEEASPRAQVAEFHRPIAEARARCPVQPHSQSTLVGFEDYRKAMSVFSERPVFALIGHGETKRGFMDTEVFSSSIHNETIAQVWGETLLGMDGEQHRRYRNTIASAFRKSVLDRWERDAVVPIVEGLIDRFAARGRADLIGEFTLLFPVYVVAEMLGLPRADVPKFTSWAADTITIFFDPRTALAASAALQTYLDAAISERRTAPGDDLISLLIEAEIEGQRLTNQEIVNFCRILLPAGAETTARSTGSLLLGLLTHPDQLEMVRADVAAGSTAVAERAIEEALRWEPPLTSVNRISTQETEVAGVRIPAGAIVECNMSGANRDPAVWPDPDRFDITRPAAQHLAFAAGPHHCLGVHLARAESRVALTTLLRRLPGLRLDPDAAVPEALGLGFRSPRTLPALFEAS
ncbi:cytochrome P450 [Sporichthya polymorpha]|uniref:cytochrome P450 n=1 Tax=Sporichthya polymorpha TaxID=35751 RepID=UPI00036F2A7B|nr:cytochrome P450 [Sporichthya polymorpha]